MSPLIFINISEFIKFELPGLKNAESQVAIPMLLENELVGVFFVESEKMNIFKEEIKTYQGDVIHPMKSTNCCMLKIIVTAHAHSTNQPEF